jgi:hypothetical protein
MRIARIYDTDRANSGVENAQSAGLTRDIQVKMQELITKKKKAGLPLHKKELMYDVTAQLDIQRDTNLMMVGLPSQLALPSTTVASPTIDRQLTLPTTPTVSPIIQPPTEELTAMVLRSNTKSNRETTNNRLTNLSRPPRRSLRLDAKRSIFAGSGSTEYDYESDAADKWSQPEDNDHDQIDSPYISSVVMRNVYQHALGGHSYNDTISHSMNLGLSREQALYHAEMAQEIYHTAQDKVDKESKEQADKAAELLRLESEATHRNARMQEKCVQAAKASVAPMIQREVENRLQQRAPQDLSEYEQDGRSYNDLSFINSGRISSNEPNYQPYNQPYNPFDFDYSQPYNQTGVPAIINSNPVMINSATMHKPQQHNNNHGHNNQMRPRTQSPHHQSANHPP